MMAQTTEPKPRRLATMPDDRFPKASGIYAIIHNETGRRYIGSAVDIKRRIRDHITKLNKGCHHSRFLQNAWNKYGRKDFRFIVLELCPSQDLLAKEQKCINERSDFNMSKTAGNTLGTKRTKESRAKMSFRNKERWGKYDAKEKKEMLAYVHSLWDEPGKRERQADVFKARMTNPTVLATLKAMRASPEFRARMCIAQSATTANANRSASMKKRLVDPAFQARLIAAHQTPESIAKRSAISKRLMSSADARTHLTNLAKKRWADPLFRSRMVAAMNAAILARKSA